MIVGRPHPKERGLAERLYPALETGVDAATRTIFFFGSISDESVSRAIVALEIFDTTDGPIRMVLYSGGGEVDAGFALYDAIRTNHNLVVCDCFGTIHSMAVLILQAASLRRISPECRFLLHEGSAGVDNVPTRSLAQISHEIQTMHKRYVQIIADRSKGSIEDIESLCSKESYFNAEQAVALGIADEVLKVFNPMPFSVKKVARRKK